MSCLQALNAVVLLPARLEKKTALGKMLICKHSGKMSLNCRLIFTAWISCRRGACWRLDAIVPGWKLFRQLALVAYCFTGMGHGERNGGGLIP